MNERGRREHSAVRADDAARVKLLRRIRVDERNKDCYHRYIKMKYSF